MLIGYWICMEIYFMGTNLFLEEPTSLRVGSATTISPHKIYCHANPITFLLYTCAFILFLSSTRATVSEKT